jgi:hypothetical protein
MIDVTDNRSFSSIAALPLARRTVSAASARLCGSIGLFYLTMLVREPVHGMQGLLKSKDMSLFCLSPEPGSSERKTRIAMLHRS